MIIDKEHWQGQETNRSHDRHTHKTECIEDVRMENKTLRSTHSDPFLIFRVYLLKVCIVSNNTTNRAYLECKHREN